MTKECHAWAYLGGALLNLVAQLLSSRLDLGSQVVSLLRNLVSLVLYLLQVWLNLVGNQDQVVLQLRWNLQKKNSDLTFDWTIKTLPHARD